MPVGRFALDELLRIQIACKQCHHSYAPQWLAEHDFQEAPIYDKGSSQIHITTMEPCPHCGVENAIGVPSEQPKGTVFLFGDEAMRPFGSNTLLYTYSLVGTSAPLISSVETQIGNLKRTLVPDCEPTAWKIHMKSIWSGKLRSREPIFHSWTKDTSIQLFEGLADILQRKENYLFKFNITFIAELADKKVTAEEFLKFQAYTNLVMFAIYKVTEAGGRPVFHFDSHKDSKAAQIIHQWAVESFSASQKLLLYPFLSHGISVPEPIFVPPASMPLLEVADVMSFMIARYHYLRSRRKEPDVDLSVLGETTYMTLNENATRFVWKTRSKYPWEMNYPQVPE